MKRILCATLVATALGGVSAQAAEESVIGAAQRELKRQQFYTGEITNTFDEKTKGAVRRLQIRRGLKVTGELDSATLAVLATPEAPAAANSSDSQSGEDRPPARERSQSIVRDDVDILRELEAEGSVPPPQGNERGVLRRATTETTSSAPDGFTPEPREASAAKPPRRPSASSPDAQSRSVPAETPRRHSLPAETSESSARESAVERSLPSNPRRELPAQSDAQVDESVSVPTETRKESVARDEILETVNRFVASWQGSTPDRELSFYADSVNYFDQGRTAHSAIARDQRNYYRRWPEREFSLLSKPEVVQSGDESATVRYRFRYELRNGTKSARGRAEHFVRFERERDGFKVASLRERKITD